MLSAYELQRLKNVAANNAVLAQLGLAGDNSLRDKPPPKKKPPPPPPPSSASVEVRRSSRVSGQHVDYSGGLSDDYFRDEERRAERPERKRSAPTNLYSDEQALEIQKRENRAAVRRKQAAAEAAEAQRKAQLADQVEKQNAIRIANNFAATRSLAPSTPFLPSFDDDDFPYKPPYKPSHQPVSLANQQHTYYTSGERAQCPKCGGFFVLTKQRVLRQHDCRPREPSPLPPPIIAMPVKLPSMH